MKQKKSKKQLETAESDRDYQDEQKCGIKCGLAVYRKDVKKSKILPLFIHIYQPQKVQFAMRFHSMKLNIRNDNRILQDTRGHKGPHVYTSIQGFQTKWYKFFQYLYKWEIDHLRIANSFQKKQKFQFMEKIQKSVPKVFYPKLIELELIGLRIKNIQFIAFLNAPVLRRLNLADNDIVHTKALGKFRRINQQRQQKEEKRERKLKQQKEKRQKQTGKKQAKYNQDQIKPSGQIILKINKVAQLPLQRIKFCHQIQSLQGIAHCLSKWQKKMFTVQNDINIFMRCQLNNLSKEQNFYPRPFQLNQFDGERLIPTSKKLNKILSAIFVSKQGSSGKGGAKIEA